MLDSLSVILDIQELDMKMIRLMRLKKERQKELTNIYSIKEELKNQLTLKDESVLLLKKEISLGELELEEAKEKIKKLESQQEAVKKVEEYNALTKEISAAERNRHGKEQKLSDAFDNIAKEEDLIKTLKDNLKSSSVSSEAIEKEIFESIRLINNEGLELKEKKNGITDKAPVDIYKIYERLLRNKRDRIVVPLENRCCSGCHIVVTAQHENLVRKGERLVFCEHCSRIHYWPSAVTEASKEEDTSAPKRRRRKSVTA